MERIEKIRERILQVRMLKGYSQEYVGKRLHMSQISYHKIECGKTALKVSTLLDLAIVLEVTENYLLGRDK